MGPDDSVVVRAYQVESICLKAFAAGPTWQQRSVRRCFVPTSLSPVTYRGRMRCNEVYRTFDWWVERTEQPKTNSWTKSSTQNQVRKQQRLIETVQLTRSRTAAVQLAGSRTAHTFCIALIETEMDPCTRPPKRPDKEWGVMGSERMERME